MMQLTDNVSAGESRYPITGVHPDKILEGVDEGIGTIVTLGDRRSQRVAHRLAVYEIFDQGGQAVVYFGIYLNQFETHPQYDIDRFLINEDEFSFLRFGDYGTDFRTAFRTLDRSCKRAFRILKQRERPGDAADVFNTNILHENVLRIEHLIVEQNSYEQFAYILEAADTTLSEFLQLKEGSDLRHVGHPRFLEHWIQVFRGLAAVHARSHFCADISPNNTFVNIPANKEEPYTLKLGDFFANQATIEARIALHGWAGLNNPLIMAPEEFGLVLDTVEANQLADVYRVCAMLHHAVFGRYPVAGSWNDRQKVYEVKAGLASRMHEMQEQLLLKQTDPERAAEYEKREHVLSAEMRGIARDLVLAKEQYYQEIIQNTGRLDEQLIQIGAGETTRDFLIELFQRGLAPQERRISAAEAVHLYENPPETRKSKRQNHLSRGVVLLTLAALIILLLITQTTPPEKSWNDWHLVTPDLVSYTSLPSPADGWHLPSASELDRLFDGMSNSDRLAFFSKMGLENPISAVFFSSDSVLNDDGEVQVIVYDAEGKRQETVLPLDVAYALWTK